MTDTSDLRVIRVVIEALRPSFRRRGITFEPNTSHAGIRLLIGDGGPPFDLPPFDIDENGQIVLPDDDGDDEDDE